MDSQITKEGIRRDHEAVKRVGIGVGYIGVISGQSGTSSANASKVIKDEWLAASSRNCIKVLAGRFCQGNWCGEDDKLIGRFAIVDGRECGMPHPAFA